MLAKTVFSFGDTHHFSYSNRKALKLIRETYHFLRHTLHTDSSNQNNPNWSKTHSYIFKVLLFHIYVKHVNISLIILLSEQNKLTPRTLGGCKTTTREAIAFRVPRVLHGLRKFNGALLWVLFLKRLLSAHDRSELWLTNHHTESRGFRKLSNGRPFCVYHNSTETLNVLKNCHARKTRAN